jgi:DNA-binding IclR family transcriptional regulator
VAAPIRSFDEVVAAVSVCGPCDQVRAQDLRPLVMWTAAEISRSLMTAPAPLALA